MIKLKREVKVGLFALITLAALYWGTNLLKGRDFFNRNNKYYATYDQVNGIQKASAIVIKGYKVGVISDITYDPLRSEKIVIEFSIKNKFRIPDNSSARIYSDGILGGKAVEIELGSSEQYLNNGDTLRSFREKDLFDIAGSELEFMKQKINKMAGDISETLIGVNSLLADNAENISVTLGNLADMSTTLSNVIKTEEEDMRSIIDNMNALSSTLRNNAEKIDGIMTNVESFTDSLSQSNIPSLVNSLTASLGEVNTALAKVNNSEGTLGKLVGDEALYDSLVAASGSLAALLDDLKANPKRYVQFSLFGRNKEKKDK